jgi:hypothetical protein
MWTHLPRTVLAVATFLSVTVDFSSVSDADDRAAVTPPAVELVDMPPEFTAAATWATDLFDQAGFDLPPLRYVFHGGTPEPCAGRPGLQHPVEGVNVIEICTSEMSPPTQVLILHETAHAWIDHTITDERKAAFQQLRGWTYWRNYDAAEWHDNGTEQAAVIMVWGLIDRPMAIVQIDQHSCGELDAGYRALTGQAPLHGFRDAC